MDYYFKNTTVVYNYCYFIMLICFGISLDHLQTNVHEYEVQSISAYCK